MQVTEPHAVIKLDDVMLMSCYFLQAELEESQKPREKVTLLQFIKRPSLRRPFLIGIALHLSQQLSGIVGVSMQSCSNYVSVMKGFSSFVVCMQVLYYSTQVFATAGVKDGDIATVVVVATLVVFTLITVRKACSAPWYTSVLEPSLSSTFSPFFPPSLLPSSYPPPFPPSLLLPSPSSPSLLPLPLILLPSLLLFFFPPLPLPPSFPFLSLPPSPSSSSPFSLPLTPFQAFLIDVVGRRTLMLYGLGGMAIFFTLFTSMFCFQVLPHKIM